MKEQHAAYIVIGVVLLAVAGLYVTGNLGLSVTCTPGETDYIYIGKCQYWWAQNPQLGEKWLTQQCSGREYEYNDWKYIGCRVKINSRWTGNINEDELMICDIDTPEKLLYSQYVCSSGGTIPTTTSTTVPTTTTSVATTIPSTTTTAYTTTVPSTTSSSTSSSTTSISTTTVDSTTPTTSTVVTTIPASQDDFNIRGLLQSIWDAVFAWWWPW